MYNRTPTFRCDVNKRIQNLGVLAFSSGDPASRLPQNPAPRINAFGVRSITHCDPPPDSTTAPDVSLLLLAANGAASRAEHGPGVRGSDRHSQPPLLRLRRHGGVAKTTLVLDTILSTIYPPKERTPRGPPTCLQCLPADIMFRATHTREPLHSLCRTQMRCSALRLLDGICLTRGADV